MSGDPASLAVLAVATGVYWVFNALMEADYTRRERVVPDPSMEEDVLAAVGPLPPPLTLSVSRRTGPGGRCARIAVRGVCASLGIGPETRGDIDLGDPALDPLFAFQGPRSLVGAMMDHHARGDLLALARMTACRPGSLAVADGTLRVDAWRTWYRSRNSEIVRVAKRALALAERLQEPPDIAARLARNALADPLRDVRLSNLRVLVREHDGHPATRDALRTAVAHQDPELRLLAARALGDAGRPVLLDLARDTAIEDETSASAIEALADLSWADLKTVLAASLGPPGGHPARPFTARACADVLGRAGDAAVPTLTDVVRSANAAVGLAGVRALRRIGTVGAVLPLTQAAESGVPEVRAAARVALEEIQFGLKGTRGAVSLAGGQQAGALSVADDPSGRVSLPAGERKA